MAYNARAEAPRLQTTIEARALGNGRPAPAYPRPINGILLAITVMNGTFASSGSPAMYRTASATWRTSIRGSAIDRAVRLQDAARHALGHLGRGVADVDLAANNVERAAVERDRFREPGDRVLGRGVWRRFRTRRVRRNRPVVDDAAAARRPALSSDGMRFLRAQKRACQIDVHDRAPLVKRQFVDWNRGRADRRRC